MIFLTALVGGELNMRLIVNFCASVNYVHRYLALQIPLEYRSVKRSRSINLAPVIIWHSLTRSHRQCRILVSLPGAAFGAHARFITIPFIFGLIPVSKITSFSNTVLGAVQYARSGKACRELH